MIEIIDTKKEAIIKIDDREAKNENLKDLSTKDLVEELYTRKGVEKTIVEPYEDKEITFNGPSIVLTIID